MGDVRSSSFEVLVGSGYHLWGTPVYQAVDTGEHMANGVRVASILWSGQVDVVCIVYHTRG